MSAEQKYYVERARGWWWVTRRDNGYQYAQTETKEIAEEICAGLNNGRWPEDTKCAD